MNEQSNTNPRQDDADSVTSSWKESAVGELLIVAAPAVITMTSYTVMQFVDKLIVKELGPDAFAATGNGGIAAFVPASILMGVLSIVNTYVSQNLGAGSKQRGAAYAWNGLHISTITWLLVLVPFALFLPQIFHFMREIIPGVNHVSPEVAALENTYGQISLYGMVFMLWSRALGHFFYGIHKPIVVMLAAIAANIVNVVLCYYFVIGPPQLGVAGAAFSTIIGGFVEFLIPLIVFLSAKVNAEYHTRSAWRWSTKHVKEIIRVGWPAGAMSGNEIVCWWIFMTGFVATFDVPGEPAVYNAAGWAVLSYMHLSFMPAVGFSIALTAVVGKWIGAKKPDVAKARTWLGLGLSCAYMSACAVCFVVFREQLIAFMTDDGLPEQVKNQIIAIGASTLILAATFQFFDAIAIALVGALRGSGDTVFPGVITIILSWVVIVGGGLLTVNVFPEWKALGPWGAAAAYIILLAIALFIRFISGAWLKFDLLKNSDTPKDPHNIDPHPRLETEVEAGVPSS